MKTKSHDKKHKHKKHKKEKHKEKTKKKRKESTSESDSESENEEWVERSEKAKRDDWMENEDNNFDNFIPTYSRGEGDRKKQRRQKSEAEKLKEKKFLEEKELNPYWKNDGCGLPMQRPSDDSEVNLPSSSVGDGGYSWLKRAYDRVKEQAASEGRTMEEVAVERWGSLEKLENMLSEAKHRMKNTEKSRSPSLEKYNRKFDNKYRSDQYSHHRSPSPLGYKSKKYNAVNSHTSHSHGDTRRSPSPKTSSEDRYRYKYSDSSHDSKRFLPPSDDHWPSWKKKRKDDDYEVKSTSSSKSYNAYQSRDSSASNQCTWKKKDYRKESSSDKYSSHRDFEIEKKDYSDKSMTSSSRSSSSHQPAWKKKDYKRDSFSEKDISPKDSETEKKIHDEKSISSSSSCSSSSYESAWKKKNFQKDSALLEKRFIKEGEEKDLEKPSTSASEIHPIKRDDEKECEEIDRDSESSDDSEAEITKKKEAMKDVIMNRNELNLLAARALRAEFCTDFYLAEQIQTKLDIAKALRQDAKNLDASFDNEAPREEITEYLIDSFPLPKRLQKLYHTKRIKKNKIVQVGAFKKQYFDDALSLKEMFQREKTTTIDDQLKMYVDAATASKSSATDDFADDDVSGKIGKKMDSYQKKDEVNIQKAIQDYQRQNNALEKCRYCLDKPHLLKHTIVAKGNHVFICVPPFTSLTEGHCFIIPNSHISSSLHLEEDEYNDLQIFKRGLIRMFGDEDQDLIFMETSVNQRYFPHMVVECIPVPKETADMAPMYFKKAIDECETEWSQNKKLIDLSKKGLRHSVPKGLPYFSVEFSFGGGFAHIIEDEKNFPRHFGKEIIGGMMEIDSHLILKAKNEPMKDIFKKTLKMIDKWWKYKKFFES